MTLNEYQQQAMTTCLPESENFSYMMLNLAAEVGEIAGKVAKMIRKGQVRFEADGSMRMYSQGDDNEAWEREYDLRAEAGDVLWQLSGLCSVMGWELDDIARQNLQKLADRQQRHVIYVSGDNR